MKTAPNLMRTDEYVRVLRPLLPPGAFVPRPERLWLVVGHLAVVAAGYAALRHDPSWWYGLLWAAVIGHSLGCLAFQKKKKKKK